MLLLTMANYLYHMFTICQVPALNAFSKHLRGKHSYFPTEKLRLDKNLTQGQKNLKS